MRFGESIRRQILLAHVSGIPVRADIRWIFVIVLMTAITAASIEPLVGNLLTSFLFGLAATLIFFISIFLHEYSHAIVARFEGLHVVEIVLHPFGGLARFRNPPDTPRAEFRVAAAGPAASFLMALLFALLLVASQFAGTDILSVLLALLAIVNLLIAIFNLLPGYPLDGGRILRAYLWKQGRDLNESTLLTGRSGQVIAIVLVVAGIIFILLRGEFFTGFWAALVGLFLFDSATAIIREVSADISVCVEDVMSLPAAVSPDSSIQHFVDTVLPMHRRTAFAVAADRKFEGMILLEDLKSIDRDFWRLTFVREVMRPAAGDMMVRTGDSLTDAKHLMESNRIGAVAVIDKTGFLVGLIHKGNIKKRK